MERNETKLLSSLVLRCTNGHTLARRQQYLVIKQCWYLPLIEYLASPAANSPENLENGRILVKFLNCLRKNIQ